MDPAPVFIVLLCHNDSVCRQCRDSFRCGVAKQPVSHEMGHCDHVPMGFICSDFPICRIGGQLPDVHEQAAGFSEMHQAHSGKICSRQLPSCGRRFGIAAQSIPLPSLWRVRQMSCP